MSTDDYFIEQNMDSDADLRERCQTLPTRAKQEQTKTRRRSSHGSIRGLQSNGRTEKGSVTRRNKRFPIIGLQIPGPNRRYSHRSSYSITTPCSPGEAPFFPIMKYETLWGPSLILKLTELIVAALCAILYSLAVPYSFKNCIVTNEETMNYYMSSAIFPYIVFCAFIIISGVIVLGHLLGQPMPGVLNRTFGLLAVAMFLTSSGVTLHRWLDLTYAQHLQSYSQNEGGVTECSGTSHNLLISSGVLAMIGAFLHSIDIVVTLHYTVKQINAIAPVSQKEIAASAARKAEAIRSRRISENFSSSVV